MLLLILLTVIAAGLCAWGRWSDRRRSLRDAAAVAMLQTLLAAELSRRIHEPRPPMGNMGIDSEDLALTAYELADALVEESTR